jgi:pimeloyl-ACP methyl ester carboxylesterase
MTPNRTGSVRGLTRRSFHRIAFTDWGPASATRPVICVHGLTRNGRDFDHLAAVLAGAGRRAICLDLPGRGRSERLQDSSDYALPQYCSDMTVLMAALDATEVDWIGTSLGGLVGMVLAALPGSPIRRIVINDIGPYLPWTGLLRLGANLNDAPKSFETIEQAESYYRRVLAPFGKLEDAHWRHLTTHSVTWRRRDAASSRFAIRTSPMPFETLALQRRSLEILARDQGPHPGDPRATIRSAPRSRSQGHGASESQRDRPHRSGLRSCAFADRGRSDRGLHQVPERPRRALTSKIPRC